MNFGKREFLKGLSYGVFFYNSKVFGLRDVSENKDLKAEQFTVLSGQIVFQEFVSKTVKGGLKNRKFSAKTITQYSCPQNPRCVVDLFFRYFACIPNIGPFYRRPLPQEKKIL